MIKLPQDYPLYDGAYNADFPIAQSFLNTFNVFPSRYFCDKKYNHAINDTLLLMGFDVVAKNSWAAANKYEGLCAQTVYYNANRKMFAVTNAEKNKKGKPLSLEFYYDLRDGEFGVQIDLTRFDEHAITGVKSNISLMKFEGGYMDTMEYDISVPKIDLTLNYGEGFAKVSDLIVKRLNTDYDKGVILFHGEPGTGKTSYIKYLTSLVKDKEIIIIPPSMAESLSDPSMIPFLMEHKNAILIIEDGEKVISDREASGSSMGVSNILNLTDGILGDCLGIQIIITFNMKRERIDAALLRKGRLIAEHKFTALTVNETNRMLKHLGKDAESNKGLTLAEIYNIDEETYKTEVMKSAIGFGK
jgi:hypothetical protein